MDSVAPHSLRRHINNNHTDTADLREPLTARPPVAIHIPELCSTKVDARRVRRRDFDHILGPFSSFLCSANDL